MSMDIDHIAEDLKSSDDKSSSASAKLYHSESFREPRLSTTVTMTRSCGACTQSYFFEFPIATRCLSILEHPLFAPPCIERCSNTLSWESVMGHLQRGLSKAIVVPNSGHEICSGSSTDFLIACERGLRRWLRIYPRGAYQTKRLGYK